MKKEIICPLDGNGEIIVNGKKVEISGIRKNLNQGSCFIKSLQKQGSGLIAARGRCDACGINIQVGQFVGPSAESLTREEDV